MTSTARGVADVVFCLDASSSMTPCLEGVKAHVADFVRGLSSDGQTRWDLRFEFAAYSSPGGRFRLMSTRSDDAIGAIYGHQGGSFFGDIDTFRGALVRVDPWGDEATLPAIDCCLDLPWRPAAGSHRILVVLTDEAVEDGVSVNDQVAMLPDLIAKVQALGVMLFLVAPDSSALDRLSMAQRSEYQIVNGGSGLSSVDFSQVLGHIGRSVSVSRLQAPAAPAVRRALYGQDRWPLAAAPAGRVPLREWAGRRS